MSGNSRNAQLASNESRVNTQLKKKEGYKYQTGNCPGGKDFSLFPVSSIKANKANEKRIGPTIGWLASEFR